MTLREPIRTDEPREDKITGPHAETDADGEYTGSHYVRCTECGRESLTEGQLLHRDECTLSEADR